jgi:hypothetical protein
MARKYACGNVHEGIKRSLADEFCASRKIKILSNIKNWLHQIDGVCSGQGALEQKSKLKKERHVRSF